MSFFSITARAPLFRQAQGDTYKDRLQVEAEQYVLDYQFGYRTGSFTLRGEESYLHDWFANGLARDISWRGPDKFLSFRGYVTRLAYEYGGFVRTRDIDKMGNRIILVYNKISAGNPPVNLGKASITVNDTESQKKYGIKTIIVSGGERTEAEATAAALSKLSEISRPLIGETQTTRNSKTPVLKVRMAGNIDYLKWYTFLLQEAGTTTATALAQTILGQDPNGVFTDFTNMDANSTVTVKFWDQAVAKKSMQKVIDTGRELITGVSGERWVGMVFEGNRFIFKAAEGVNVRNDPLSTNKKSFLYRRVKDSSNLYTDTTQQEIPWWHVRPDSLVFTQGIPGPPMYVAQVSYVPPVGLTITGLGQRSSFASLLS